MSEDWPIDELFDEDYLHFYASMLSDEVSDIQAEFIWSLLDLAAGQRVLDLACGHGRIANRLAQRGAAVTGLDATALFLEVARHDASNRGVTVDYVQGDVRALPWADHFDTVLCWFTAFGYFDDEQNRQVLSQVFDSLKVGGRFLVELNHKDGLLPRWVPSSVERSAEGMLIDERTFDPLTGQSTAHRTIVRHGRVRHATFVIRLFSFTELRDWLFDAGFRSVEGLAGDGSRLTPDSTRMILIAQK